MAVQDVLVVLTNKGREYFARVFKEQITPAITKFAVGDGYVGQDPNPDAVQLGHKVGDFKTIAERKWGDDDAIHHSVTWVCNLTQNAGFTGALYEVGMFTTDATLLIAHGTFPLITKNNSNEFRFNICVQF